MANTSENLPSVELFYRSGTSDKIYNVQIAPQGNGYMVNAQNGRRGGSLSYMVKTASPVSLYQAQSIYNELVDSKKAKGYTENPNGVPYAQPDPFTRRRQVSAVSTPVPPPMAVKAPAVKSDGERAFTPQLLNPITEEQAETYIEDDDYMAQEKKNGQRVSIANDGNGNILGFNKLGKERPLPSEVVNSVPATIKFQADGELIGETFWVFDIIDLGGESFKEISAIERVGMIDLLNFNFKNIKPIQTAKTTEEKRALFLRLKAENAEGIVFKRKDAPYTAGRPSSGGNQFKCKFYKTASVIVTKVNAKRSVAVAVLDYGDLVEVGNVTIPPNKDIPPEGALIEVRYLYAYKGGSLYQPTYLEDRSGELEREECSERQLIYKGDDD